MEIVVRENVTHLCQLALGKDVAFAELLLGYSHVGIAISVPYNFAPVNATAVDSTAVVENYTFKIVDVIHIVVGSVKKVV